MEKTYTKKIFTAEIFFKDLGFLIWNIPKIISTFKNTQITKVFIEKIMNITTAVNGCVYCSWYHAKQALDSGISEEEIKNMLNLQFHTDATEFELLGLIYAQHYAETNRTPDSEMTKKLFDFYGEKTGKQIILIIRMIFFGNLYGNTWDAVLSRLKGKPAKGSNVIFEIFYFLLNFIIMIPLTIIMKLDKNKMSRELKNG